MCAETGGVGECYEDLIAKGGVSLRMKPLGTGMKPPMHETARERLKPPRHETARDRSETADA